MRSRNGLDGDARPYPRPLAATWLVSACGRWRVRSPGGGTGMNKNELHGGARYLGGKVE
ncbi:hypothetical protein [Sphingomonas sp. Mn802worker]|uniref:hypothetical protein n=1 Tax=Sphingomonas sp. Mn802worker TaxID=629773 RepID=UPI001EE6FFE2|nr:hypothetical protein [Sphingomonas sp. Mn802worker]